MVMITTRSSSIMHDFLALLSIVLLLMTTASLLTIGKRTRAFSSSSALRNDAAHTAQQMEDVVRRYFDGVNRLDPVQIRSCFAETATIRDVSSNGVTSTNTVRRTAQASALVERSMMKFVTEYPDSKVDFYYGPEKGRTSDWVVVHWFVERGRVWSAGENWYGMPPTAHNKPLAVLEGQTRFLVDREALKITDMVVTRTFTEWEELAGKATS
jgi:hypothetical protein